MNMYKNLDLIFPCGKDRHFGEVVSTQIDLHLPGSERISVSWKRKAWYVNASVNAFHMHRGLVRELGNFKQFIELSFSDRYLVKRYVALCILNSYLSNHVNGTQYHLYIIEQTLPNSLGERYLGCWWKPGEMDYREIVNTTSNKLYELVNKYVDEHVAKGSV